MDVLAAAACSTKLTATQPAIPSMAPMPAQTMSWTGFDMTAHAKFASACAPQMPKMPMPPTMMMPSMPLWPQATQLPAPSSSALAMQQQQPLAFPLFTPSNQAAAYSSSLCQNFIQGIDQQRQDLLNRELMLQEQQMRFMQFQQQQQRQQLAMQQQLQVEQQMKFHQELARLQHVLASSSIPVTIPKQPNFDKASTTPSLSNSRSSSSGSKSEGVRARAAKDDTASPVASSSDIEGDEDDLDEEPEIAEDGAEPSKRRFWTSEDYMAVIDAYRTTHDAHLVAKKLGMPASTAKSIIGKFRRDPTYTGPKKRGGPFHQVYSKNEFMNKLLPWLESGNSRATLNDMIDFLKESCGKVPSRSTLANWLEGELIVDSTRSMVARAASSADMEEYSKWVSDEKATLNSIFIGSQHVSMWSKRCRGQASRAVVSVPVQKNVHVVCLIAVSPRFGPLALHQVSGSVTAQDMTTFIRSVLDVWSSKLAEPERNQAAATIVVDQFTMLPVEFMEDLTRNTRHACRLIPRGAGALNPLHAILDNNRRVLRELHNASRCESASEDENWASKMKTRCSLLSTIIDNAWDKMSTQAVASAMKSSALLATSADEPPQELLSA